MAEDDVDGRAGRQSVIEIDNVKPAAIVDANAPGQISRLANGHRGDVHTQNLQASPGQPDAAESLAASESSARPAVGNNSAYSARTLGASTASTAAGLWLAYRSSQRRRSFPVTGDTLRLGTNEADPSRQ